MPAKKTHTRFNKTHFSSQEQKSNNRFCQFLGNENSIFSWFQHSIQSNGWTENNIFICSLSKVPHFYENEYFLRMDSGHHFLWEWTPAFCWNIFFALNISQATQTYFLADSSQKHISEFFWAGASKNLFVDLASCTFPYKSGLSSKLLGLSGLCALWSWCIFAKAFVIARLSIPAKLATCILALSKF